MDELTRPQQLSAEGRRLLINIAAGHQEALQRTMPGYEAAKKRRERTYRRARRSAGLAEALAS